MLGKSHLEKLYDELNPDKNLAIEYRDEDREPNFLNSMLYETLDKYLDPKYDKGYIHDEICSIVDSLQKVNRVLGFKQGLTHALRLMTETLGTPEKSQYEIEQIYRLYHEIYYPKGHKEVKKNE